MAFNGISCLFTVIITKVFSQINDTQTPPRSHNNWSRPYLSNLHVCFTSQHCSDNHQCCAFVFTIFCTYNVLPVIEDAVSDKSSTQPTNLTLSGFCSLREVFFIKFFKWVQDGDSRETPLVIYKLWVHCTHGFLLSRVDVTFVTTLQRPAKCVCWVKITRKWLFPSYLSFLHNLDGLPKTPHGERTIINHLLLVRITCN